ncbi:hypothetical protein F5H01DRAFT_45703 [Linnemannia elongata]|nr:hypothetical protein F5H01DRAFT_45703 [Linnemannia elongata]
MYKRIPYLLIFSIINTHLISGPARISTSTTQTLSEPNSLSSMYKPSTLYRAVTMMVLASFVFTYVQAYSWTANGGCTTSWAGRCNAQCKGEALSKWECNGLKVDSGVESSNCIWICKCKCI